MTTIAGAGTPVPESLIEMPRREEVVEALSIHSNTPARQVSLWKARIICLASFLIVFTACGLNFVFGVYQDLYQTMSAELDNPFTGASPAKIDLIGTLAIALMTAGAPFVVAWSKHFSPHAVAMTGGVLFGVANVLASFGQKLWHFALTQGVMAGLGSCMSYLVACTVAPSWFTTHRGLAMGLITSGTGIGGVVWAPALRACIDRMGFRDTLRLTGCLSALLLLISGAVMDWEPTIKAHIRNGRRPGRARPGPRHQHRLQYWWHQWGYSVIQLLQVPLLDWKIVRTRMFAAQALGSILHSAAYYTPVFFFVAYTRALGYDNRAGANFTALSNACNAVGKIVIGHIADRCGRLNTLVLTTLLAAVSTYAFWLPSTLVSASAGDEDRSLYMTFLVLYGIFASAYIALFPTSLVELFGAQHFVSINGVLYMVRGLSTMVGTPVGSSLIKSGGSAPADFLGMTILVGALLFGATVAVSWVRLEAYFRSDTSAGRQVWRM